MTTQKLHTVAFVFSVVLNAFLIGFIVSRLMLFPGGPGGPHGHGPEADLMRAAHDLSPDARAQVEEVLKEGLANAQANMTEMRDLFAQLAPVLEAPKFDPEQYKDLIKRIDQQDAKIKENLSRMIFDIATQLSDADRIEFFKYFQRFGPGMPPPPHPGF